MLQDISSIEYAQWMRKMQLMILLEKDNPFILKFQVTYISLQRIIQNLSNNNLCNSSQVIDLLSEFVF